VHIIVYKGQVLIKATFSGSLEWPLYTRLTVLIVFHMKRCYAINNIELSMLEKLGCIIRNMYC